MTYRISFVISHFARQFLPVAIILPFLTYILGLSVLVTTSISSPSLPMEVSPNFLVLPMSAISLFKRVVFPTFFSIPIIDILLYFSINLYVSNIFYFFPSASALFLFLSCLAKWLGSSDIFNPSSSI